LEAIANAMSDFTASIFWNGVSYLLPSLVQVYLTVREIMSLSFFLTQWTPFTAILFVKMTYVL